MSIKLQLPALTDLSPRLTVCGVGGAGCNAINNMIAAGLQGVDFIVANTDAQALAASSAEHRIQLGIALTEGLGAGSKPEIGEAAAEEAIEDLRSQIAGSHMVFIAAGMGGGTGTGAAAVIARVAKELGILTVGIVTKPFHFEGTRRMRIADIGIAELKKYVDTMIVIPNQNLFRVANEKTTFAEAFVLADQVLYSGVACIVDLIIKEGLINLDFADVRTVMGGMGTAMMGTGEAAGERRAIMAAEEAIANPLLDDVSLRGARGLLLSISGGRNLTLYEVDEAASRVREEVDPEANIIVGATFDESLGDRVRVSIVASGMMRHPEPAQDQSHTYQQRGHFEAPAPIAPPAPSFQQSSVPVSGPPTLPRMETRVTERPTSNAYPPRAMAETADVNETHDVQRRLSAALQPAEPRDPFKTVSWPQSPVAPPLASGSSSSLNPQRHDPDPPRGAWQAPGSVMIEETPPPTPTVRRESQKSYQAPPFAETFTPGLPVEVRRAPRKMPDVDDFPVIAQREYRAKSATQPAAAMPDTTAGKRPGLFERLSGMSRKPDDSYGSATHQANPARDQRSNRPTDTRNRPSSSGDAPAAPAAPHDEQHVEMPGFFSRDRR
jgi:cell division protein FtsZ